MNIELFVKEFESVFDNPPTDVCAATELRTLSAWDSLAAIGLLAMVNARYDVILSGDELMKCQTVQDICDYIVAKQLSA